MKSKGLSVDSLADRCAEETKKFIRQQNHDTQFCFELLRLALLEDLTEAFTHVYRVYESQVMNWVYQHSSFRQSGENADYFVSAAFSSFYFALRGTKFGEFDTLAQVLSYLKMCVYTAVAQYVRDQRRFMTTSLDDVLEPGYTQNFTADIQSAELWDHVCGLLPDEADRELAQLVFVQRLKPAEIAKAFPEKWQSPREVSVALQRIRRTLRRDPGLRGWAGSE